MNLGGIFSTGPTEAAWVVNWSAQCGDRIASQWPVNGEVQPGTRTAALIEAVSVQAHVPLSGRTMEFDGKGSCGSGLPTARSSQ